MERDKQDRHETPVGVRYSPNLRDGSLSEKDGPWKPHQTAENDYEALMSAAPHEDIEDSYEALSLGAEWMADLLDILTEKERSVIELVVFGQRSLSEAGYILGLEYDRGPYSKMGVSKIRDNALRKMRDALVDRNV